MEPSNPTPERKRGALSAPIAAIVSVAAAMSCCLPFGFLIAGAGLLGLAGFFGSAQPYLLALSVASLAFGFYQTYRRRSCAVRRSKATVVLLWTSAAFVAALFLFPQQIAGMLADIFPSGG